MVKKVYLVENLDCANCASKVEAALNALPEVQEAVLTYATMHDSLSFLNIRHS